MTERLKELEAEYEQAKKEYGALNCTCSRALNSFDPLFWYLVGGIEQKQPPTVKNILIGIAADIGPADLPVKSFWNFLQPIRAFYLNNAKEADRENAAKMIDTPFLRVLKKCTFRGEPIRLDAETIGKQWQRFKNACRWLEVNAEKVETARTRYRETKRAYTDAKREQAEQTAAADETAETKKAATKSRFLRKVEEAEKGQYGGKLTTLLDGQYRGRVW